MVRINNTQKDKFNQNSHGLCGHNFPSGGAGESCFNEKNRRS